MTRIERILARLSPLAPTLLRIGLGVVFLAHAYLKAVILGMPAAAQFFVDHGFAGWMVYPVFAAELGGGLALVAGVRTRLVALGLVPVLLGALATHAPNGWSFSAPGGGWEYVAFLLVALLVQALLGDGAYALGARAARVVAGAAAASER